jgi:O-antigen/teichoic acid export membrane protein
MRRLATNSTLAFAGDLASKVGLLLVMVVAARALPVGELAVLGTALAVAGILAVCLDAGAGLLITRDGARDEALRGGLLAALLHGRRPAAVAAIAVAAAGGILAGEPAVWVGAALLGILGALTVSLTGYFRAGQDMRPEAVQKTLFAGLALAGSAVAVSVSPSADGVIGALVGATLLSLGAFVTARRPGRRRAAVGRLATLRRALPLGLMAIATVVYYRSGTVGLALLATPEETAAFTVASAVGFGLLMLPNAITTGLLPHLSAGEAGASPASTRLALRWSLALSAPIAVLVAVGGFVLLGPVFGAEYADAAVPLAILCAAVVVIAYNGILGTALLAAGHVGVIGLQVACSLAVYLATLALLSPGFGAAGAAAATVICEVVAAAMLTVASLRRLPGLHLTPRPAVPAA